MTAGRRNERETMTRRMLQAAAIAAAAAAMAAIARDAQVSLRLRRAAALAQALRRDVAPGPV